MRGFEFPEKLLGWPGPAFAHVLQSLPDPFLGVSLRREIEQALVRVRILNDCGSLSVHRQHNGALALFDLLQKFAGAATESG